MQASNSQIFYGFSPSFIFALLGYRSHFILYGGDIIQKITVVTATILWVLCFNRLFVLSINYQHTDSLHGLTSLESLEKADWLSGIGVAVP